MKTLIIVGNTPVLATSMKDAILIDSISEEELKPQKTADFIIKAYPTDIYSKPKSKFNRSERRQQKAKDREKIRNSRRRL